MTDSAITAEVVAAAETLMGVDYTAAERAAMLDNLDGQIEAARAVRALRLGNETPMATRFDPRLAGAPAFPPQAPLRPSAADPGPPPGDDEDIAFAPVTRLSAWIRGGALTSRRLTEIYLARIAEFGPRLECFVTVTPDRALAEADAADALLRAGTWRGPLHGIPYGLKDLFDTRDILTTWGAMPYRTRVPATDARIVEMLRAAGAVLLGKTTLGALAYGDIWFGGRTRNPWNLNEGSSGSSAGSAAATAAGLCGFSIGTETLGSITSPSQRCGTTGLRPTFGRVSRAGAMALCWTLDKVGPICRSVEDCALVLAAINGGDPADRGSIDAPFNFDAGAGVKGLRLGYVPATFEGAGATDVDRAALAAARRLGVELVEVALPDLPYGALVQSLFAEAAAAFEDLTLTDRDDELVWQEKRSWPNAFRKARFLSAVDHVQRDRLRYLVMQAYDRLFAEVDFLIGPFAAGPHLVATNFTGHPCLHLRAGYLKTPTRDNVSLESVGRGGGEAPAAGEVFQTPQGVSLWSGLFDEGRLCALGMALEAELGVAGDRPGFPA